MHCRNETQENGANRQSSRGLASLSGHFWVSFVGCTGCDQSNWRLGRFSESHWTSVSGSAGPHGLVAGAPSCVHKHTWTHVRWRPLFMVVPPQLKRTESVLCRFQSALYLDISTNVSGSRVEEKRSTGSEENITEKVIWVFLFQDSPSLENNCLCCKN